MSFWKELKRRNVYKVGIAYLIVAWLIVQAAAIVFPHLNLPSWAVTFLIVFLIIGFPLILLFAWAFEITPDGLRWTKEVPLSESITHLTGRKLNYILVGVIVLALAYIVFDKLYIDRSPPEITQVPAVSEEVKAKKTIAVLPFVDISPEKDQEYFVDGLSEELLNTLAQIPDLGVTARTSSFTFKNSDKTVQEIASVLCVENVLEGSVRKAGTALRITAQLVRASDGLHLWSKTYDRELKDIFVVQEDIATAVADELKATLGIGESLKQLGSTDNVEAYELFLVANGQMSRNENNLALESINASIALDPEFALAWVFKARMHLILSEISTPDSVASEQYAALKAAQKAVELEPNLAAAHGILGGFRTSKGDWIEAELEFRKATELTNEPQPKYTDYYAYFIHYSSVGNFKRLLELLEEAIQNDPFNIAYHRDLYIWSLFLSGDMKRAEEENERGKAMFGDQWIDFIGWFNILLGNKVSSDELPPPSPQSLLVNDIGYKHLNSPKEGIAELRRIYINEKDLTSGELSDISVWASVFGDPEFTMDTLERLYSMGVSVTWGSLWSPNFRETRQLPRFKEYVKKIGLVDYWNEFGWPDICRPLDNGDFECD